MTDCLFCRIINNDLESAKVYEDDSMLAIMDVFPESKGHLLLMPKKHATNLFDCDEDTLTHIIKTSKLIASAAKKVLPADGIKIAQFNGHSAGQTVFHYHMHIVPAYEGTPFKRHAVEAAELKELQCLAKRIKGAINGAN